MLLAGAWVGLPLATNIGVASLSPSARLEGDVVRLKGTMVNETGSNMNGGTTGSVWATIPVQMRSAATGLLDLASGTIGYASALIIDTSGNIRCGTTIGPAGVLPLDGVTYTLN